MRGEGDPLYRYRFGSAEFDEVRFELRVASLVVEVQRRPLEVLRLLLRRAGELVTRQQLLDQVWEGRPTVDNVLANALTKLRTALGPENAGCIVTQARLGYRLTARVDRIAVGHGSIAPAALTPDQSVPRRENFLLERIIGRSSGSAVWLARHVKTNERRVYKFSHGAEQLEALKREAALYRIFKQALGDLDCFVRIIDWNFEFDPYFIECAYGGEDLLRWAETEQNLQAMPLAGRLEIVQQILDAVATAHSLGVLHKDLKPSNILLLPAASGWQVRVTDFGASLRAATTSGAPIYSAPELLSGGTPTVQSEVYSLGILLYQIAVGDLQKPIVSGWERDIGDELLREDIAAATDGDPAVRLSTVSAMADRLRRLEQRREQRASQRNAERLARDGQEVLRRTRARRPWLIATYAILCLGLTGSLTLYGRIRTTQEALGRQYDLVRALNAFLIDHFVAAANPSISGRTDLTVIEAAHEAARHIDTSLGHADLEIRGSLHAAMQDAFSNLSDFDQSIEEGHKALADLSSAHPQDAVRIAEVRVGLAATLAKTSKYAEAADELDAAATDISRSGLERSAVSARYYWARGALAMNRLAIPQALDDDRRAWELAQVVPDVDPAIRDQIHFSYAEALKMSARFADAEREAEDLAARQRARLGAAHPETCFTEILIASARGYAGHTTEAVQVAEQAAACLTRKLGPSNLKTVSAFQVLADLQFQAGRFADAAENYRKVASSLADIVGPRSLRAIMARMNEAVARQHAGDHASAEGQLASVLDEAQSALGWSSPTAEALRYHLADLRLDDRRTTDVGRLLEGLTPTALNEAQIESDWDGRLAYQRGRLALYAGDGAKSLPVQAGSSP